MNTSTQTPRREQAIRDAVASACILATARHRTTKGFASLDTKTVLAIADTTFTPLVQALRRMEALGFVVLGELDRNAVDVALTARGLGAYLLGEAPASGEAEGTPERVTTVMSL